MRANFSIFLSFVAFGFALSPSGLVAQEEKPRSLESSLDIASKILETYPPSANQIVTVGRSPTELQAVFDIWSEHLDLGVDLALNVPLGRVQILTRPSDIGYAPTQGLLREHFDRFIPSHALGDRNLVIVDFTGGFGFPMLIDHFEIHYPKRLRPYPILGNHSGTYVFANTFRDLGWDYFRLREPQDSGLEMKLRNQIFDPYSKYPTFAPGDGRRPLLKYRKLSAAIKDRGPRVEYAEFKNDICTDVLKELPSVRQLLGL